jgi:hypothetical protein
MNEAKEYRRAFAIGLLTLGVAVGGQLSTSRAEDRPAALACKLSTARSLAGVARLREPLLASRSEQSLAQRVARAVIGAVLNGIA